MREIGHGEQFGEGGTLAVSEGKPAADGGTSGCGCAWSGEPVGGAQCGGKFGQCRQQFLGAVTIGTAGKRSESFSERTERQGKGERFVGIAPLDRCGLVEDESTEADFDRGIGGALYGGFEWFGSVADGGADEMGRRTGDRIGKSGDAMEFVGAAAGVHDFEPDELSGSVLARGPFDEGVGIEFFAMTLLVRNIG